MNMPWIVTTRKILLDLREYKRFKVFTQETVAEGGERKIKYYVIGYNEEERVRLYDYEIISGPYEAEQEAVDFLYDILNRLNNPHIVSM